MVVTKLTVGVLILVTVSVVAAIPSYYNPSLQAYQDIEDFLEASNDQRPRPVYGFDTDYQGLGTVSGVDVDSHGRLLVFHRANRPWVAETFQPNSDVLTADFQKPIDSDTILILDPISGKKISGFGAELFNVPHGISTDKDDNVWVTDVGRHQVLRIPMDTMKPNLELGVKFEPGSDDDHFCKPTDVAVASSGDFFVSDGYCNSRVMKFSSNGTFLTKWGTATNQRQDTIDGPDPFNLDIPHGLTLVEELDLVCVADREHMRALCYNAGLNTDRPVGAFNRTLIPEGEMGKVFAIDYNPTTKTIAVATEIARVPYVDNRGQASYPARAYTYTLTGQELEEWAYITPATARYGPSLIHDLTSSQDGQHFFLADVVQQRVLKYSRAPVQFMG